MIKEANSASDTNKPELRISEDGSTTLYLASLDEHYHSYHGAIQESMHLFIKEGLAKLPPSESLNILEIGFGTGLNALLTLMHKPASTIHYHSLEKFPLGNELTRQLNYPELLGDEGLRLLFNHLHDSEWNREVKIHEGFYFSKHLCDFRDFSSKLKFDLIYFDAFGPDKQPELWSAQLFGNIASMTAKGGLLTSYSAKGTVRRTLEAAGFSVERIPGPPGKRQMIRATKQ